MKPITLQEIRRAVGGKSTQALPAQGVAVSAVCTDTRAMSQASVFVAINMHWDANGFALPTPPGGTTWHVVANTGVASPDDCWDPGSEPRLGDQSGFLLGPRSAAEAADAPPEEPVPDISRVVGCPLGTVRSRIHHAKRALRRALQRTDHHE